VASNAADHLHRLEGLAVGIDVAQGVFDGPRFLHADLAFTLRFPDGWETVNTPQAVGAMAPDRRMQIRLELAGEGHDLAAAAAAFEQRLGPELAVFEASPVRVAGREAFRLTGSAGGAALISTFLAHRGAVYQLSCLGGDRKRLEALCTVTTRSFRPMTPELLAHVTGLRLALVAARAGETLAALGSRSGNVWSAAETAAWNARVPGAALRSGEWIKIARSVPWTPAVRK
jgi:predicted Zn-dependent protease